MDVLEDQLRLAAQREADQHVLAARLHERLGEQAPARSAFRAALRVVPDHPLAHQHLAEAALREGNRAAAEAHLAVLQRAHPDHAATRRIGHLMAQANSAPTKAAG
nr:tetratricopeptide repeat protein [Falsiroseomonas tokyonensis]